MVAIDIVQQGAWDMPLDSMPLAAGYLKASLEADADIGGAVTASIRSFRGGEPLTHMARTLFAAAGPDILAFSVLGWNYRNFCCLAETYKQIRPDGLVVFGGNHVSYQGERVLRECASVDIVVNGEGEFAIRDIARLVLEATTSTRMGSVAGISFRDPTGAVVSTPDRDRIDDLDIIASPFLTGAIPMTDVSGRFRYDVALMETNRGCPYKCAFCYWGGAVGQRVRAFSRERIAAELDYFGFHHVPTVVLCDANFGLLERDEEFVDDLIRTREKYGYPRALETSWAKNKAPRFYAIVQALRRHHFKSSFTLALQTLSDEALTDMQRRNMKVNAWESLASWLAEEGLDCYAELIWGAPGETVESFLDGYDRLAATVNRIAVYPLLLLPNTAYTENREQHGFVTLRGERDDFEYVLASRSATMPEHLEMQRFMYFARIFSENQYLRHVWQPARQLVGMTQSAVIRSLMAWFDAASTPAATAFLTTVPTIAESPAIARGLRVLYADPALDDVVECWWTTAMVPRFPPEWRAFAEELYRYERHSRPRYVLPGQLPPQGWRAESSGDTDKFVSGPVQFAYDPPSVLKQLAIGVMTSPDPCESTLVFEASAGFYEHCDNHETAVHYMATSHRLS